MPDFIPDSQFIPDAPAQQPGAAPAAEFIPDSQFVDDEEKYGSLGQQAVTALEGAASALTFGASTAAEVGLGLAKPEDVRMRRETNPIAHVVGELGGVGAGLLSGIGAPAAMEAVGARVAGRIVGQSLVSQIGSQAAKLAAENVMFTAGDEVSRMFTADPHQSMGTAMADIGLSGLIGGATGTGIGVVSPLWKATAGKSVESLLNGLKTKAGGIDGITAQPIREALDSAGVELAPEVRAMVSGDPQMQRAANVLMHSDTTTAGPKFQETVAGARQDLAAAAVNSLGKDAKAIDGLEDLSKHAGGQRVGDLMADEIRAKVEPLAKEFEELKGKAGNVELTPDTILETPRTVVDPQDLVGVPKTVVDQVPVPGTMSQVGEKIAELASKEGWLAAEGTPIESLLSFVQKNLRKQKDLKDLGNFISRVGEKADSLSSLTDRSATRAGSMIKNILRDAESSVIETKLGEHGAELVQRFKNVRQGWRQAAELADEVTEQLGVKSSVSGFSKALREYGKMEGEALLRKVAGSGNAAGLKLLQEKFPAAAEAFKQFQLDSILKNAASKATNGEAVNLNRLIKGIEDLSPEMRAFVVPELSLQKIKAIGTLLEQIEKGPKNFSNTARTMDKLNQYIPGGAVAMAGALSGHGVMGLLLSPLAKVITKDAPDALRLATLKFMGSNRPIDSAAFKAMADVSRAVYRGEAALTRGARGVFESGSKVVDKRISENDREKLDKQIVALRADPMPLMRVGGDMGHYIPDHTTVAATMAAQAVNYLNSIRPDTNPKAPLDSKLPADPVKEAQYKRALDIANNPLIVLNDVKDGSLTVQDLTTLQNVAPGLYERMRAKLNEEIISRTSEDDPIPYTTRLGLALFLGQPLDSTMNPMAIQSAQPKPQMAPQGPVNPTATGMQKLSKLGPSNATQSQARAISRIKNIS